MAESFQLGLNHLSSADSMKCNTMRYFISFLIAFTLTCPVMCWGGFGSNRCCIHDRGELSRTLSPACCSHCLQQNPAEDTSQKGIPPQPGRPCGCSCLCGGAVLVESVCLPDLPVVWFVIDLWAPLPPESVCPATAHVFSCGYDRCPIAGSALRIVECSLRC